MRLTALLVLPFLFGRQEVEDPLKKGFDAVTPELLKEYLGTLASDEYEGRCAGYPGNDKAAVYIATRLKEAGLKPVGQADAGGGPTYFQPFLFDEGRHLTRNCVGLLEGSDPARYGEIVVIGAHFDHVGRGGQHRASQLNRAEKDDDIWNGADDNGSGTTTVLGVLKAFAASGVRPKRSILFIWFSAEEWGLLGSRWYADHPIFPLDRTVAMINLDMTGRTDDEDVANAYGIGTAEGDVFRPILERAMVTTEGFKLHLDPNYGPGSDHVSFADKKVPIFGLGEKGPCPDYHKTSDHADRINYPYMVKIAKAAATALREVADLDAPPQWNPSFKLPAPKEEGKARMGIYLAALEEDELAALKLTGRGAFKANEVLPGGAGDRAGVRVGDVISALDGSPFDPVSIRVSLNEMLEKIERGRDYTLEVYRDGKRLELKISWPPAPPEPPK